jgi:hypothetical protein
MGSTTLKVIVAMKNSKPTPVKIETVCPCHGVAPIVVFPAAQVNTP